MSLPPELQQRFDHVKNHIFFDWDGQHYSVPFEAYPKAEHILLPTGKVLKVLAWSEVMPPTPHFVELRPLAQYKTGETLFNASVDYTDHLG